MALTPDRGAVKVLQVAALARPTGRVLSWQPLAQVMVAGLVFVTIGSQAGVSLRLSIAGAAVAAATAFLVDDPAAVTLAASPTSLPIRRLQRVAVGALAVGFWWTAAVSVATHRAGGFPLRGRALELGVFVAIALAVSAATATIGDRTPGGIAGAVFTTACFAMTLLPSRAWLPFPADPSAPGAAPRLLTALACAVAVLAWASRDPAHRPRATLVRRSVTFRRRTASSDR